MDASASGCAPTDEVSPDPTTFDLVLQNEVCNSSTPCVAGRTVPPASIAFASGTLDNPSATGNFRVAQVAFCATALGTAAVHCEFSPPAPSSRHSQVVDAEGQPISNRALYTDYVINVVDPNGTPHPRTRPYSRATAPGRATSRSRTRRRSCPSASPCAW